MIWVAWRQLRTQALVTFGLLAAFAVLVIVSGLDLRDAYRSFGDAHCSADRVCRAPLLTGLDKPLTGLLGPALLAIPALLGMFWGAPLVAREFETGTHRLAWTQSVTRRRWLSVRVALVAVAALIVAGLASWLVSWWFAPIDRANLNRLDPSVFTARGIVALGYAGFAFALGVATGALARRTLPAMAATLLGFIAARLAFTSWVRPHLLTPTHVLLPVTQGHAVGFLARPGALGPTDVHLVASLPAISNAWSISTTLVDRAQHALSAAQLHSLLARHCPTLEAALSSHSSADGPQTPAGIFSTCLHALSPHLQLLVSYLPSRDYWQLQAAETGIFLAAALLLVGTTTWLIGRRPSQTREAATRSPRQDVR
ncbi:MAG: transporter [Solirubrobacteraceae bacterium]